jgi:hypothetical protein
MKRVLWICLSVALTLLALGILASRSVFVAADNRTGTFIAFSLKEGERHLSSWSRSDDVTALGGMTDILGLVHDEKNNDLIIIGQRKQGKPSLALDDFVVAMRAVYRHNKTPLVSIEKTGATLKTGKQVIYWEGGIENTQLGKDMLDADILLKNLALGKVASEIWGVRSYLSMTAEQVEKGVKADSIGSRFWFKNLNPSLAIRDGVFAILDLRVGVQTEVLSVERDGKSVQDLSGIQDEVGENFARQVSLNLDDLSVQYPVLARAKPILAMVSLAEGMRSLEFNVDLNFWLNKYKVSPVQTRQYYDLIEVKQTIDNRNVALTVSGGLELNPIIIRLNAGDVTALKEVVLGSRPAGQVVVWNPPLDGWIIPGTEDLESDREPRQSGRKIGFSVERAMSPVGQSAFSPRSVDFNRFPPLKAEIPKFTKSSDLTARRYADIGGVMLHGPAQIEGGNDVRLDLSRGGFSFIVDGNNARLDPAVFRKFVTALWAVYYGKESPGISIDPVDPKIDKQLVRYIGNVINSDLGRVMREADYTMKKWAVGTEKPDIPGFKDVDELMAKAGVNYFGASRRFWFVPENMKFKRTGETLLFSEGRMTLKTEYMFQNKPIKAEPADEKFAEFFTTHYEEIAEKYPVYKELFEYAKLVSLAQFLKQSGVPLCWFLTANKDLILTEDSAGTVDQLVRGSRYFQGVEIIGGVNLQFKDGQYVFDQKAVTAMNEALAKIPNRANSTTSLSSGAEQIESVPQPLSFDVAERTYTLLPQQSLTSGKDRWGIRYQSDIALRQKDEVPFELVRYYNASQEGFGDFGEGWHLLVPYRVKPTDENKVQFQNISLPKRMTLQNLLTGEEEILAFSDDRYSIVGYVPDDIRTSQVLGLFLMSDASFRLADKLGNEYHFDQAGFLTDMLLGEAQSIHYEYNDGFIEQFDKAPYELRVADSAKTDFLNVSLPKRLEVQDLRRETGEVLEFKSKWGVGAYVPQSSRKGKYRRIVLMTDGSFRLFDVRENEIAFDAAGAFGGVSPGPEHLRVIRSVSQEQQKVKFTYTLDENNSISISKSYLVNINDESTPTYAVNYHYDQEGRLARVEASKDQLAVNY